jgi:hypothetical protein
MNCKYCSVLTDNSQRIHWFANRSINLSLVSQIAETSVAIKVSAWFQLNVIFYGGFLPLVRTVFLFNERRNVLSRVMELSPSRLNVCKIHKNNYGQFNAVFKLNS